MLNFAFYCEHPAQARVATYYRVPPRSGFILCMLRPHTIRLGRGEFTIAGEIDSWPVSVSVSVRPNVIIVP